MLYFIDAVKRNKTTAIVTKKDVESALSKWFLGSRDRGGNRETFGQNVHPKNVYTMMVNYDKVCGFELH